jgi:hypothetical protein
MMQIAPSTIRPLVVPPQSRVTRGEIGTAQPIDPVTAVQLFERSSMDNQLAERRQRGTLVDLRA